MSGSPPRCRMMTWSSSRGVSPAVYTRSDAHKVKSAAAAHYQPLDAKYPDIVRAPSVSRGYSDSFPDFCSSRLVGASARGKSVECDSGSDVGGLRHSVQIGSRVQNFDPSAQSVKPRGRRGEVLREAVQAVVVPHCRLQANEILQPAPKAPKKFSSKPEAICKEIRRRSSEAIRPNQESSMCTDLVIRRVAGLRRLSDQGLRHYHSQWRPSAAPWQKDQRGFSDCWSVWPWRSIYQTRARSRSSSGAQEACNGYDSSKAKTKAKYTKPPSKPSSASDKPSSASVGGEPMKRKHSKKPTLGPVPTFRDYPYTIGEIPRTKCDRHRKSVRLRAVDIGKQDEKRHPCTACMKPTNLAQVSMYYSMGCKVGEFKTFICASCYFETAPSTVIAIACMKEYCTNVEVQQYPILLVMMKKSKFPSVSDPDSLRQILPWDLPEMDIEIVCTCYKHGINQVY